MNPSVTIPVSNLHVGLLAIQGDFGMHRQMVESLGYECREVRTIVDLGAVDCLIMPGGESTTMRKILKLDGLWEAIPEFAREHAVMGTCAGLILLGKRIIGGKSWEDTLSLIDLDSDRNAYGSQYHSSRGEGEVSLGGTTRPFEMVFIRAPKVARIGDSVEVFGRFGQDPTMLRQGNILALTFHPELSDDSTIHRFFLDTMAKPLARAKSKAA